MRPRRRTAGHRTPPATGGRGIDAALAAALWSLTEVLGEAVQPRIRELGLTRGQAGVVYLLVRKGETTVGGLASILHVTLPTVTGVIDDLEEAGLVVRTRSAVDRRQVTLAPTALARRRWNQIRNAVTHVLRTASADIPAARKREAAQVLAAVTERMVGRSGTR